MGLHSGEPCAVELTPADAGGLRFLKEGRVTPVHVSGADAPGGSTRFPGCVETPEHLLAAVMGLGITELEMRVEGDELPALDGSAREWVAALGVPGEVGTTEGFVVSEPISVELAGGRARALPSEHLELAVDVDFGPACRGTFEIRVTPDTFRDELCWARTFLPHGHLDAVLAAGRGLGAEPGSVVILGARGPLVPVRGPDECIRHKALDLLGDLALLGGPVRGRFEVERGTHALHQALVRALLG